MSQLIKFAKVVSSLPETLENGTIYLVKSGSQVLIYVTNTSGLAVAYPVGVEIDLADELNDGLMSSEDKTKLNNIQSNATANSSDAALLDRGNHTGTQSISTVTGLSTALDGKQKVITQSETAPVSPAIGDLWIPI